ncbi:hypothetical protein J7T55_010607 [Diaporthe amygdali]|uniref:uncharacterized protein n=1 Tax=Phomopsis amygdali TaxID=1214568 RepID=UPI0022FE0340|nr:uncharacterized protein J7T55_010607 [Diaporthe amygdali]KAJ0115784.1 hypothetical protein J7T55_010607 [Diaporthe amygdali]
MPSGSQRKDSLASHDSYDRRSSESYGSRSTAPTSVYTNSRPSEKYSKPYVQYVEGQQDLSPATSSYPRSSVDTYASTDASEEDLTLEREEDLVRANESDYIPPLPAYHHEISEPNMRPSTPKNFSQLFPSMNRLSIRHDDFTTDGNMNLRVDTIVPGRRRTAIQLFHLRMYDLARREFSLRRYCRDSGREVCSSKRKFVDPASSSRPSLQRSMSSAMKAMARPQAKRTNSSGSFSNRERRPSTSHSRDTEADVASLSSRASDGDHRSHQPHQPTNSVKLEFSNYARVDVARKGQKAKNNKRYEFNWWGHKYVWKRVVEKHLDGVVSFHLVRDGETTPVAHIVPETRSPNQVEDDEASGGWVPPCFMWINDQSIIDAVTDVADVIVATGLIALVDDCIKERWQPKKSHHIPVLGDVQYVGPRAFVQRVFSSRRNSASQDHHPKSPLRNSDAIDVY